MEEKDANDITHEDNLNMSFGALTVMDSHDMMASDCNDDNDDADTDPLLVCL